MHRTTNKALILAAAAVVSSSFAPSLRADIVSWTNASGNSLWTTPANWTPHIPTTSDAVIFPLGRTDVINLGGTTQGGQINASDRYTFSNGTLNTSGIVFFNGAGTVNTNVNYVAPFTGGRLGMVNLTMNGNITSAVDVQFSNATMNGVSNGTGKTYFLTGPTTFAANGSAPSTSSVFLANVEFTLMYDPSGPTNRLNDSASIYTQANSALRLINTGPNDIVESIGTITMPKAMTNISLRQNGAGQIALATPAVNRSLNATMRLSLSDNNTGAPSMRITQVAPALVGGGGAIGTTTRSIVPWMFAASASDNTDVGLVTYNASDNGVRALNVATEYASSIAPGSSANNVRLTAPASVSADSTINGLVLHDGGAVSIAPATTFTIASGAVAMSSSSATANETRTAFSGNGTLAAPGELILHADSAANGNTSRFVVDAPINAGNLVKSGNATVVLNRANTIAGSVNINAGALVSMKQGALGDGVVAIHGGKLVIAGESQTIGHPTLGVVLSADIDEVSFTNDSLSVRGFGGASAQIEVADGLTGTITGRLTSDAWPGHSASPGALSKLGKGRLVIAATTPLQQAPRSVTVNEGTLELNSTFGFSIGSITGPSTSTFAGTGNTSSGVRISGMNLSPGTNGGDDIGRLTVGLLFDFIGATGELSIELAGTDAGSSYDQLAVGGGANFQARDLLLSLDPSFTPAIGAQFLIVDDTYEGAVDAPFIGLPEGRVFGAGGSFFKISYIGGDGNDVVLTTVVPEPSILGLGALACLAGRRKRRSAC